jgi:hypothetical protein
MTKRPRQVIHAGADPMVERGILNVNGRDIGAAILK